MSAVVTPEHRRKALRIAFPSTSEERIDAMLADWEGYWHEPGAIGATPQTIAQALADEAVAAIRATEKRIAWYFRDLAERIAKNGVRDKDGKISALMENAIAAKLEAADQVLSRTYGYRWAAAYAMNGGRDPE